MNGMRIKDYYSGLLLRRRKHTPTYDEARRDYEGLARVNWRGL